MTSRKVGSTPEGRRGPAPVRSALCRADSGAAAWILARVSGGPAQEGAILAVEQFIAEQLAKLIQLLNDPDQWLALAAGAVAALLIVVSTLVKTIIPLRWLAVGGNIGFVVYGLTHPAPMVAVLHAALLPINLWRVLEMQRLTRRVMRAEAAGSELQVWLQPYMKRRRMRAGTVLFRQGDHADRVYVLAEGRLEVVESGRMVEAGEMFGEIGFFAPGRRRTATVRSLERSTLLSIDETTFRQLFYQNPAFGFEVVRLIAGRLSSDVQRLSAEVQRLQSPAPAAAPPPESAPGRTAAPEPPAATGRAPGSPAAGDAGR
jgi:CRP/FNR family cyclic AMP-dependent transcriptional regulator